MVVDILDGEFMMIDSLLQALTLEESHTLREDALGIYSWLPALSNILSRLTSTVKGIFELENGGGLFGEAIVTRWFEHIPEVTI